MGKSLPTQVDQFGKILKRYGSLLTVASIRFPGGLGVSPGSALRDLRDAPSAVELNELRERVKNILRESGSRIVVLIDDIDRLDRQEKYSRSARSY